MTTFLIVQHAEKQASPDDPPLTQRGRWQAREVGRALTTVEPFDLVVMSDLRRSLETAGCIIDRLPYAVTRRVDSRIRERMNWTRNFGVGIEAFLAEWSTASADRDYRPIYGESSRAAGNRFKNALMDISNSFPGGRVLVVGHGGVTIDLVRTLLGDDIVIRDAPGMIENGVQACAITKVSFKEGIWQVEPIGQGIGERTV